MKGSMTVEASYVFPFCILVIAVVCYLGIFQYDQAVLKITGYECILQVMELREESEELLRDNLLKKAEQTAKMRMLGVQELKATVKITTSQISVSYSGTLRVLKLPLEVNVVYERTYPELTLRILSGKIGESYEGTIEKGIE